MSWAAGVLSGHPFAPPAPLLGEPTLLTTGPRVSLAGVGPTLTPSWTGSEIAINPGDVWSTVMAANPAANTVFRIKTGVHRRTALGLQPSVPMKFIGEPGAIVTGAIDVGNTGWTLTSGVYSKTNAAWPTARDAGVGPGAFLAGYTENHWCEDLSFDQGTPLTRVAGSTPTTGQWAYNSSTKTIYLADNPAGHQVEVSFDMGTTNNDFMSAGAERVVVQNLTIRMYPSANQQAAITTLNAGGGIGGAGSYPMFNATNGYDYLGNTPEGFTSSTLGGWLIDHCQITLCHSWALYIGAGTTVSNCDISTNGQGGGKAAGRNPAFLASTLNFNNYTHYDPGVEAGGFKCVDTWALHFADCQIKQNYGVGLWCDYTWLGHVIEHCQFLDNYTSSIAHEQTEGTEIRYCQIIGGSQRSFQSGNDAGANSPGGQLFIGTTRNAHIHHNVIDSGTGGWGAVALQEQERGRVTPASQGVGAASPGGAPFAGLRATCSGLNVEFNSIILRSTNNGNAALWYAQGSQDYSPYSNTAPGKIVGWIKQTHTDEGAAGDYPYTLSWDNNWYHLPATGNNTDPLLHSASDVNFAPFPFRWDGEYGTQLVTGTAPDYTTTNIYSICTSDGRRFGSFTQWQTALSTPGTSGGGFGQDAHSTVVYDQ